MIDLLFKIAFVALVFWLFFWLKRMLTGGLPSSHGHLTGDGSFSFDIVGESHYQDAIEFVAGGRSDASARIRKIAMLVPESDNPHDTNAVRVDIEGRRVGYLSRGDAVRYRNLLKKKGLAGLAMTVDALIVGGWDRGNGDRGLFGVKLDLYI